MRTHAVDSTIQKPLSKWPIRTCFTTTQQYLTGKFFIFFKVSISKLWWTISLKLTLVNLASCKEQVLIFAFYFFHQVALKLQLQFCPFPLEHSEVLVITAISHLDITNTKRSKHMVLSPTISSNSSQERKSPFPHVTDAFLVYIR